jgi:hypothetical protein
VRLRRSWPAAIALVLLLSACGGSGSQGGSRSEAKVGGWSTHHVADGGFSLQVPAAWKTLDKLDSSSVDDFLADNPQFEPYRQVFTSGLIKLMAFDPDVAPGFATNVNVLVHNLGTSMSLSQYADATKAQIARATGAEPQLRLVQLPAGRCARVSYEMSNTKIHGKKKRLALQQVACLRSGSEYVVTFTTLASELDRYRTTFDRAARSFDFD